MIGPIIGAVFLTAVFTWANVYLPHLHPIFTGALVILVMLFLPDGVMRIKKKGKSNRWFRTMVTLNDEPNSEKEVV